MTYFPFLLKVKLIYSHVRESCVLVRSDSWAVTDVMWSQSLQLRNLLLLGPKPPGCFRLRDGVLMNVQRPVVTTALQKLSCLSVFCSSIFSALGSVTDLWRQALDSETAFSFFWLMTRRVIFSDVTSRGFFFLHLFFYCHQHRLQMSRSGFCFVVVVVAVYYYFF